MGSSEKLEQNFEQLSKEMEALKKFRSEIAEKKARQMQGWMENVESKAKEFDELQNDMKLLKGSKSLGNLRARTELDRRVTGIRNKLNDLKDGGDAFTELIENFFNYLTGETPKRFTPANLSHYTSGFSTKIDEKGNDVYKGQFPNKVPVVVKLMKENTAVEDTFMAEMNIMYKTSHRNVVKLYGFCFERNMKALVFEYMPNESLDKVLFENRGSKKWEELYDIAIATAKGLSYLHDGCEKQILHGDIKASNILLDSEFSPKITNFGITKLMSRDKTHVTLSEKRGDPCYPAPEINNGRRVTHKCDVYSFGMLLLEILGRRRNIKEKTDFPRDTYWEMFKNEKVDELMSECNIEGADNKEKTIILARVAFWCIQYKPEGRPSMNTIVKMLEKEIQVLMPPNPFKPTLPTKPHREVVYKG